MIVVYRQGQNLREALSFFGLSNPTELPFVDSTLGNVSVSGWRAFSDTIQFYVPKDWTHLDDGSGSFVIYDDITTIPLGGQLVVFTDINVLPITIPDSGDIHPNSILKNKDVSVGYGFNNMRDFLTCKNITMTEQISYIQYTLPTLLDTILASSGSSKEVMGKSYLSSGPIHIDEESDLIGECRIYGPCIIMNSIIVESTVYPGSVIINSKVHHSKVEGSYLHASQVERSVVTDSVAYSAAIENTQVVGSILPKLTHIVGKQ